ncbi:MAG: hypothetical protein HFJ55_06655 [Clostridia bacterium]|jgi:outer membrane lipoprotein-sorting protein|nr:hypothetical protein [Clostridia bacterium]
MKKKYWLMLLLIIVITIICVIFYKNRVKDLKIGNNKNSQEIVDYILNISSYEAQVMVNITSNKNNNKYLLKQTYQSPNISRQEVIEPNNIAGVILENDGTNLKIENSNLNLNKIIENYSYLGDSCLDLHGFIENYKNDSKSLYEEKDEEIIMKTSNKNENIYIQEKLLHIDKKTNKPTQMEIKDNKQKTTIYILYNEVKVNSTK